MDQSNFSRYSGQGQLRDSFGNLVDPTQRQRKQKNFWTMELDGYVMETLNDKCDTTFELSSTEFIDLLFKLPPEILNRLLKLPQHAMFKRIFCYWKQLNQERVLPRKHSEPKVRKCKRTLIRRTSPDAHMTRKNVDSAAGQQQHETPRERQCRFYKPIPLKVEPVAGDHRYHTLCDKTVNPSSSAKAYVIDMAFVENDGTKNLEEVVDHRSENDMVPFGQWNRWYLVFGAMWNWIRVGLTARRPQRVAPKPEQELEQPV